jgi:CBS domain containing-hemolysin-like protein
VEDILETLLGIEIMDEKDSVADLQRLARERWEARRRQQQGHG